jgi:hypothetical protein
LISENRYKCKALLMIKLFYLLKLKYPVKPGNNKVQTVRPEEKGDIECDGREV